MWNNIVKQLSLFPDGVLTGIGSDGYPFSVRCKPWVDENNQVLLISPFGEDYIQPGPAGLLFHSHNQEMWDLKSFQILGVLEKTEQGWVFHVKRSIPEGQPGPFDPFQMIIKSRAEAKKYYEKRSLPRPKVDWTGIKELRAEARKFGDGSIHQAG
jgi:hypothetical protein